MAILMNTELFQCKCGCMEFEIKTFKSFILGQKVMDQTIIGENTSRKVLECIACGNRYDPKKENLIIKEVEE